MRVAFVSADSGVPVFGRKGCSVHVQEVVRALIRRGADVEIHSPRLDGDPPAGMEQVRTIPLPRCSEKDPSRRELASIELNDQLFKNLRSRPAYDLIYERHSIWGAVGMEFAQSAGIPGILEVNSPLIEEQASHRSLVHRDLAIATVERSFRAASQLIAVSKGVADYLEGFEVARGRVHVIPNGVDPERFAPNRSRDTDRAGFTVGFVGTLKPWHDLPTLVRAIAHQHELAGTESECRLLVVGDGPERGRLEEALRFHQLMDSAHLTGAVDPADVPRWLDAMDVGVAPYSPDGDCYFSPLKIFEYMAAGLPVVASRSGQIPELIEHESSGLLWPPGDHEALGAALERLRADPPFRASLGRRAREKAVRDHSWAGVVEQTLRLAGLTAENSARMGAD